MARVANAVRTEPKSNARATPQGCPISPLLSNIYMRRFILGFKQLGYALRFHAEIVNYGDDICILGKVPATEMLVAVSRIMDHLNLPVNAEKARCLRCPEEPLEFLGYRIGTNCCQRGKGTNNRQRGKGSYIGTRPSKASVQSLCRKISDQTAARYGLMELEWMVERLNRILSGWANYFHLGQVLPAYVAIDNHTAYRLRQWQSRKHKAKSRKSVYLSYEDLYDSYGLFCLVKSRTCLPWVNA